MSVKKRKKGLSILDVGLKGLVTLTAVVSVTVWGFIWSWLPDRAPQSMVAEPDVIEAILEQSVRVENDCGGFGTGLLVVRGSHVFVVTAAHVVHRHDDSSNSPVVVASWGTHYTTEVLGVDEDYDLALLRVHMVHPEGSSAKFSAPGEETPIGTVLLHVGNWGGPDDPFSFSVGVLSATGRERASGVFSQSTAAAYPGSSGGGLFTIDGRCVGLLLRGHSSTRTYYVPSRQIKKWADKHAYFWLFE